MDNDSHARQHKMITDAGFIDAEDLLKSYRYLAAECNAETRRKEALIEKLNELQHKLDTATEQFQQIQNAAVINLREEGN